MTVRVLVVDDSSFFRRRVSEIINGDPRMEVVDTAVNGKEAIEKVKSANPDVVTMDVEMPVMDGITAVREIMATNPVPILMFSSLTHDGAQATLNALDAGALDFLPKKFEDIARDRDQAIDSLRQCIYTISRRRAMMRRTTPSRPTSTARTTSTQQTLRTRQTTSSTLNNRTSTASTVHVAPTAATRGAPSKHFKATGRRDYQLMAIGTSTGGPVALQKVLTKIPANFPLPIILVQHMPGTFTTAFAARLNSLCKIKVKEAENGDMLRPGVAYLAPGGLQMMVEGRPGSAKLKIVDGGEKLNYKPCVDVTFGSAAKVYQGKVLAMILTGMGADGCEGSRMLKSAGATIWAQDEESCVVYGMPMAVTKAGVSSESLPLERIAERINLEMGL